MLAYSVKRRGMWSGVDIDLHVFTVVALPFLSG